jgi:hypothetical protein
MKPVESLVVEEKFIISLVLRLLRRELEAQILVKEESEYMAEGTAQS